VFKNLLIGVAIFGLGWGASFGAGAAWGRRSIASPAQAQVIPAGQFGAGAAGGAPAAAGGTQTGGGAAAVRGAAGTVDRVEGQTLFLSGPNGQQTRVTLTDQTQIMKQAPGTPADLTPGSRVAVAAQGQPGADGAITAASVNVLPEGAAAGGQGQGAPANAPPGGQRGQGQGGPPRQGG
jgi:hypothetical protein